MMADLEKHTILESDLAAALGLDDWEHPADLLSIVRALKLGDEEAAAALDERDRALARIAELEAELDHERRTGFAAWLESCEVAAERRGYEQAAFELRAIVKTALDAVKESTDG
jgi:hypothetical protein